MAARPQAPATCSLTLRIGADQYAVKGFPAPAFGQGARGFRLRKLGLGADAAYNLAETPHGPTCDCPSLTYRHEGRDASGCKHIRALVAVGLLAGFTAPAQPGSAPRGHHCLHCRRAMIPAGESVCPACGKDEFDQ